jgi:predicted metal-binding protein
VDALEAEIKSFTHGAVYQYRGKLDDPIDYPGMQAHAHTFFKMTCRIKSSLRQLDIPSGIFGAGGCTLCGQCPCPVAKCPHPGDMTIPLEACGINVSSCARFADWDI